MLNPFYDEDLNVVYLASKGESTIHVYDISGDKPRDCDKVAVPGNPMCGLCFLPKRCCDVRDTMVARALHCSGGAIQPISFSVPRAAKLKSFFHDDIFPPTRSFAPTGLLTASEFFGMVGGEAMPEPALESLRPEGMPLLSEKPVEKKQSTRPKSSTLLEIERANAERKNAKEAGFKRLEALAHQHAKYNSNMSMGSRKIKGERERIAARQAEDDFGSSDSGWSDSDEE